MFLKISSPLTLNRFFARSPLIAVPPGQKRPLGLWLTAVCRLVALFCVLFTAPVALAAAANVLTGISAADGGDYIRLAFSFENPLEPYVLRRDDVDRLVLDFGPMEVGRLSALPPNPLISNLNLEKHEDRLTAVIQVNAIRYSVRHFVSDDGRSLSLDIKAINEDSAFIPEESGDMKALELPSLAEVARRLNLQIPPAQNDGQAENLIQRILGRLTAGDQSGALEDLNLFVQHFPNHPAMDTVSYLRAEVDFFSGPPEETYARATEAWKRALERWPQNTLSTRARFMLAEADHLMGYNDQAAAQFKILANDALDTTFVYPQLAVLKAADLLMNIGNLDEARSVLEPVLEKGRSDRLNIEAYARMGMLDFFQGFFSQANEIFHEALSYAPRLYQTYPEMLYAMGEGYHYLDRPDLSRAFLFHALNLMPDHPKADVILARIGDDYRKEGRDVEAMAVYGAARRNYPDGDGGLISQVRLADMGALHSFFSQDKVFDALERGSRQATVEMYKKIVESGSASPLMQLAQLKIGTALAEDGDNAEAVKWLRDLEINNPKSPLLPEALPVLNRALVNEIYLQEELENWKAIADLYADSSSYLEEGDRPAVLPVVAKAFEKLGQPSDARAVWLQVQAESPETRLARGQALVLNSLEMGQPLEALNYAVEMARDFPEQSGWLDEQFTRIGRALAAPANSQATDNLMNMVASTTSEPARRDALADAIEIEINSRRYDRALDLMNRYRRDYPSDDLTPEYILTQAKIEDYEQRPERAWDLLSEFRAEYPEDPRGADLLKEQIARADALGRTDDALRFMELYRQRYPGRTDSRNMLIEKMQREWNLGRYQESQNSLEDYRRDYPADPALVDIMITRSNQDWQKGRYEAAQAVVEDLFLNYPDDPRTVDFAAARVGQDWQAERYDQAQRNLSELMRLYPQHSRVADLMLSLAADNWTRGRLAEARKAWADFRRAFPDDPRFGQSYFDQYQKTMAGGFSEEAFQLADEFRRLRPQDTTVQANLLLEEAKDYLALNRPEEALAMWNRFRQAYPEDPRDPTLLLIMARQEMKMDRGLEAIAHYQEFLDLYPNNELTPDVYLETAAAESQLNLLLLAWEHLDRYRNIYRNHSGRPKALLDQVELGRRLGRLDEAINLYRIFRNDYPDLPQVPLTFLAQARMEIAAGRPESAIATLEEGVLKFPLLDTDPDVQALLTDLYLETGRVEDWAAIVERNLNRTEKTPANLQDRFLKFNQLAQVYQELGRVAEAERNFDAALDSLPPGASPEAVYAIATSYKNMLRPEKYAATLRILAGGTDPLWQGIANQELAALENQLPSPPPQ